MSSARIPWWIWLVAASFIACFLVGFVYLPLKLPEATGINPSFRDNRVASVTPGSPADAAGLKQDDRIANIDGRAVHSPIEVISALSNTVFDRPVSIVVLRGSHEVHLQLILNQTLTQTRTSKETLGWWVEVAVSLIQLLVGLLVLFKRPRDLTAVAAGIFLCSLGTGQFLLCLPECGGGMEKPATGHPVAHLPGADTRSQRLTCCAHAVVFAFIPQAAAASPLGVDDAGSTHRPSAGL